MRKRIGKTALMLLCMASLITAGKSGTVHAEPEEPAGAFSGDVEMLKQENDSYVMQVTVENDGEDFAGTVQVIFAGNSSYGNCAYNTKITLPAQGKKQFTITVPDIAVNTAYGQCTLNFLDGKGEAVSSIRLKNVFDNVLTGIPVGILSDDYPGLSFLDAGGQNFDIQDMMSSPLELVELNNDNLGEYLDRLYFLVIDRFDVSSLSDENIRAIEDWVNGGGWLLIGTGEYAEQTLSGFDEDFLDVDVLRVSRPGENNMLSADADQYYDYYNYVDEDVDFTNMAVADLDYDGTGGYFYESSSNPAIYSSFEDGAVSIFFISLGEEELRKLSSYVIQDIYMELMYASNSYHLTGYSSLDYIGEKALAFIDSVNTDVDFTWLKVMIVVYVVLAGPVLYLILRQCRKREWYWLGAPLLGILFIAGVFLLGQGIRVNETKIYSVTVQKADSDRAETYFLGYHSGTKPWEVRLNDKYETAGPGFIGYYGYGSFYNQNTDDYYYTVSNDGEGLSAGIRPDENFDSGFLYAGARSESKGTILCENFDDRNYTGSGNISGTITNGTDCDMAYMAVWHRNSILVFSDVKAGEALDLQQAVKDGRCVYESSGIHYDDLIYEMVSIYDHRTGLGYEQDDMAALLIGLGIADEARPTGPEQAVIVGVVRDYDRAFSGKCNEISYGCLYSYAKTGGGQDASY